MTDSRTRTVRMGGPLAVVLMTLGLLTWPIAFNVGAYREVFYDDIFRVLVASTILLVINLVQPAYSPPWNWLLSAALAGPLLWFGTAAIFVGSTSEALERPGFIIGLVLIAVVSLPLTLRLLVDLFTPELTQAGSRRVTLGIVSLVAVVGLAAFAFGRENHRFMTCEDFIVAGASEPTNCAR